MALRPFSQCQYSVFLSYAFKDDSGWNDWISDFGYELDKSLEARVTGVRVPPALLASKNGPINGSLSARLREAIDQSFAMIIFVHDNYLVSDWCLQELKYFREQLGEVGLHERLYIVAMSEDAIRTLERRPAWREAFPGGDQVWMQFFRDDNPGRPIDVYTADPNRRRKIVVSTEFWEKFVELRENLAAAMRAAHQAEAATLSFPTAVAHAPASAADKALVRVYIEGDEQQAFWESMGRQVVASWDQVVALEVLEPPLRLRPTGLEMSDIDRRPLLDDADGVILLWARKTPDSLVAQINQVEPKLSGPDFAPGLVAYLMASASDQPPGDTIFNWPVVRFIGRADGSTTVLADDAPRLADFLRRVLRRKRALA